MATKIDLFNAALTEIGHRRLSDTGEEVEAGRVLNERYNSVVEECLISASWNFAMETVKVTSDTGVTPSFGFTEIFAKPADWLRTISVSQDEYLNLPLLEYYDDSNFWSADITPLYIRYVSKDTGLGFELTRWPPSFTRYVELELAARISLRLNQDGPEREAIKDSRDKARRRALSHDAMNEAQPKFTPAGSWTSARGSRRRDRGSRNSLTG